MNSMIAPTLAAVSGGIALFAIDPSSNEGNTCTIVAASGIALLASSIVKKISQNKIVKLAIAAAPVAIGFLYQRCRQKIKGEEADNAKAAREAIGITETENGGLCISVSAIHRFHKLIDAAAAFPPAVNAEQPQ